MSAPHDHGKNRYEPGEYVLDADRSGITIGGRSLWGLLPVRGRFHGLRGSGRVGDDGAVTGELAVDVASLRTGITRRDRHLVSVDFFDVDRYPAITCTVTGLRLLPAGDTVLDGSLQIEGITEPVTLAVAVTVPDQRTVQLVCRNIFDRRAFGISANQLGMVSDTVVVDARLHWTRVG